MTSEYNSGGMVMPGRKYSGESSYRYSFNGQEKESELNENITTAQYWEYDSRIGRRWNLDPKPQIGISDYAVMGNNTIRNIDPLGDNWFYYKGKDENEKTWHWAKGNKTSYLNDKGKAININSKFENIAFLKFTGGTTWFGGGKKATIYFYEQDKLVKEQDGVFSGSSWWATGKDDPDNKGYDAAGKGNYMMHLNIRGVMANNQPASTDGHNNPPSFSGIQKIPDDTYVIKSDGKKWSVNDDYGNGRIRLFPLNDNLVEGVVTDRGLYLHGKGAWYNRTHGCICDKKETIFNYLWQSPIRTNTPFVVDIPFVAPPK